MLYHAVALSDTWVAVTLVGRAGTPLPSSLVKAARLDVAALPARPERSSAAAETIRWVVESARLLFRLVRARPGLILLQAPPLFPAGVAAILAARWSGARLVIDWHNLGDSLLALRPRGAGAPAAFLAALERAVARGADGHLAVSAELAAALVARREVPSARVFRDRPHERFAAPAEEEVRAYRARLLSSLRLPFGEPLLLALSPTSWGLDEELALLLDAAKLLPAALPADARPVLLLASGSGEGRAAFEERAAKLPPGLVAVRTACVPGDEYPFLVRSADVGISLHHPAAGLDPPMKTADLLGGGVPVLELAVGPGPQSLVVPGRNGLSFPDSPGLAILLARLASDPEFLAELRAGAAASRTPGFTETWRAEAAPLLLAGTV
jgi:beta-1,4-mannosyltransferase